MRVEELAKTIDSTLLEPTSTTTAVEGLCRDAISYHFASVCVLPYCVPVARQLLQGYDVKVGTVVSYPVGCRFTAHQDHRRRAGRGAGRRRDRRHLEHPRHALRRLSLRARRAAQRGAHRPHDQREHGPRPGAGEGQRRGLLPRREAQASGVQDSRRLRAPTSSRLLPVSLRAGPLPRMWSCSATCCPRVWAWMLLEASRHADDAEVMINAGAARIGTCQRGRASSRSSPPTKTDGRGVARRGGRRGCHELPLLHH